MTMFTHTAPLQLLSHESYKIPSTTKKNNVVNDLQFKYDALRFSIFLGFSHAGFTFEFSEI